MSDVQDKLARITAAINQKAKRHGILEPVAFVAGKERERLQISRIPTGIPNLDEMIGGGWSRGGFSELAGTPGAGKSCLAFQTIAHNQKIAKERGTEFWPLYWHNESGEFPYETAMMFGIDLDALIVLDTQRSGETVLNTLSRYLWDAELKRPANLLDLVVIDSVAAVLPEAAVESIEKKGYEGSTVGRHAAMFSKWFQDVAGGGKLGRHTAFLLINQVRAKVDSYGGGDIQTGGNAMEHYNKIILKLTKPSSRLIKEGTGDNERVVGHTVIVRALKNNTGKGFPHASTEYVVRYGVGVDTIAPLCDLAIEKGVLQETSAGRFQFPYLGALPDLKGVKFEGQLVKVHGADNLKEWLRLDEAFQIWVKRMLTGVSSDTAEATAPGTDLVSLEEDGAEPVRCRPSAVGTEDEEPIKRLPG